MVSTALLMTLFFAVILLVLGKDYLVSAGMLGEGKSFLFYILDTSLAFAVYLSILKLGVRTFVGELTASFQGIQSKLRQALSSASTALQAMALVLKMQ